MDTLVPTVAALPTVTSLNQKKYVRALDWMESWTPAPALLGRLKVPFFVSCGFWTRPGK
jgi:hypothetical protein